MCSGIFPSLLYQTTILSEYMQTKDIHNQIDPEAYGKAGIIKADLQTRFRKI